MARASLPSPPPPSPSRAGAVPVGRPRPQPQPSRQPNPWADIPALLLLGSGTLLFLALISYVPDDLPSSSVWAPFSRTSSPNDPAQNFIGRAGAVVAGWFYFTFGAGSFLVAACCLFFGVGKLLFPGLRLLRRAGWATAFVVAGACLSELQPWFLHDWHDRYNLPWGAGGWLGAGLDRGVFLPLLGKVGAPIVLGVLYGCALVLMIGLHPVTQVRHACDAFRASLVAWRRRREQARLARATDGERLEMDRQRLFKEQRQLEKQLRRQGVTLPTTMTADAADAETLLARAAAGASPTPADDEFAHLPPPKITDNSAAPPAPAPEKKKPSLAEVLGGLRGGGGGNKTPAPVPADHADGGDIRFANYELPDTELLDTRDAMDHQTLNTKELEMIQGKIIETLDQFGIKVSPGDITKGPTITRYEVYPAKGVRVDRIVALEKDIARSTRAERINILAPIPGKDTVGIEIANNKKVKVTLRELLESADWMGSTAKIPLALGKDVYGKTIIADLAAMPHCLIAGATGSGKSVCINTIIASLLYRFTPEELRLVMVDPKVVELQIYNELPHLVVPVVTDAKKVLLALRWVIDEMMKRYELFAKTGVRNITGFNARPKPKTQAELDAEADAKAGAAASHRKPSGPADLRFAPPPPLTPLPPPRAAIPALEPAGGAAEGFHKLEVRLGGEDADPDEDEDATPAPAARNQRDAERVPERMPYIVVIVDELADLMQTAPADVESAIARITQMARAAGIHMIIATQTPRADVITGVIKANVPSRIAFQVASALDSRVILDENGAERLLGQGDMLYRPPGTSRLVRAQGVFVTDEEVHRLVQYTASQGAPTFEAAIHEQLQNTGVNDEDVTDEDEELVQKCLEVMRQEKKASTSMLQRRLRLGYTRAARIVDILEARGIVGPENGARGREILVDLDGSL